MDLSQFSRSFPNSKQQFLKGGQEALESPLSRPQGQNHIVYKVIQSVKHTSGFLHDRIQKIP